MTPSPTLSPTPATDAQASPGGPVTIDYTYDPLYRLTEANYSTGDYYTYTYDAVGNRLTQDSHQGTEISYQYDAANRMTSVDGVPYTWDVNGNLLNDGANTYAYDFANRLISTQNQGSQIQNRYNGLGDRLQETMNGATTTFTMDLNTGLTQALSDGTNTYLYGLGRISQHTTEAEYFLGDALGSVRQMTDASGDVTLTQAYDPYGVVTLTEGDSQSAYGYTGEFASQGLVFLRARHYSPAMGRFLIKDPSKLEANPYLYTGANPVNRTDPTGYWGGVIDTSNLLGPELFLTCFGIHTGAKGELDIPAITAVAICKSAMIKEFWYEPSQAVSDLPHTAHELMAWYIHEYGNEHLYFDGKEPLTQELAQSVLTHKVRQRFYREGSLKAELYKFKGGEFLRSITIDSIRLSAGKGSLPISFFMGSFWFQVERLNGRVGFRIDNDTSWESGTHIRGRFRPGYFLNVEDLIRADKSLAWKPLREIVNEHRVISILPRITRDQTTDIYGGGEMFQTFTWTEKYDACLMDMTIWEIDAAALDIQRWNDYFSHTIEPNFKQ